MYESIIKKQNDIFSPHPPPPPPPPPTHPTHTPGCFQPTGWGAGVNHKVTLIINILLFWLRNYFANNHGLINVRVKGILRMVLWGVPVHIFCTIDHFTVVAELPGEAGREAAGGLVLIQTSLLFLCKCRLVSITTARFTLIKTVT